MTQHPEVIPIAQVGLSAADPGHWIVACKVCNNGIVTVTQGVAQAWADGHNAAVQKFRPGVDRPDTDTLQLVTEKVDEMISSLNEVRQRLAFPQRVIRGIGLDDVVLPDRCGPG